MLPNLFASIDAQAADLLMQLLKSHRIYKENAKITITTIKYYRRISNLEHIASTSCLVIVGARFLKKIEVVLCRARGFSGLTSSSIVSTFFSSSSSSSSFTSSFSFLSSSSSLDFSSFSSSLSLLLEELLLLPE